MKSCHLNVITYKVWQVHTKGKKLNRTVQSIVLINLVLRNHQKKSRLPEPVLPKYLSRIRAGGNKHLSCVQMAKLFNEGFGKRPRIKFKMVPFVESLNTSPVQALRCESQTCHSVPVLKVPAFRQQQSTGARSETQAEPTLESVPGCLECCGGAVRSRAGRTGAPCCSAGLGGSGRAGRAPPLGTGGSAPAAAPEASLVLHQERLPSIMLSGSIAAWPHYQRNGKVRVLMTNRLLSFHQTSAAAV